LIRLLPPPVYAFGAFVVFSGALILIALAYWLATKPLELHRTVGLKDHWPQIIGAVGLGAIVLYFLARGATFQQTRSLYIGLLIWGAYIVADAATTLLAPRSRLVRAIAIVVAVALAVAIAFPRIEAVYTEVLNQVAARRALLLNESQPAGAPAVGSPDTGNSAAQAVESGDIIANAPQYSPDQKAQAYVNKGQAYYSVGDYRSAAEAYRAALDIYAGLQATDLESVRSGTAVALTGYARSLQKLGDRDWGRWLAQACAFDPSVAPECSNQ
jgi:tetratricopeptide (TPR) repeat protein